MIYRPMLVQDAELFFMKMELSLQYGQVVQMQVLDIQVEVQDIITMMVQTGMQAGQRE